MRTAPTLERETKVPGRGVLKRILLGRAISTSKHEHHLLPKILALPVFSSDPLSSVAYATEEMMVVLSVAGAGALALMLPLAGVIAVVLAIVITSYRQTVRAYPHGGGSYIVARENLGTIPGLFAAAAILQDYVLTVAVSVTAGTVAVVSAFPGLAEQRVAIAIGLIAVVALANLRGVREAGTLFAIPTYGFVITVFITLGVGLIRCASGCPSAAAEAPLQATETLGLFLVLKAFASGSTALTGVEAIADGVQAFRRPQSKNAATTLAAMGAISISMFLGITFLARVLHVRVGHGGRSVLAQIGDTVFSGGAMFFVLQVFTALILILAANTAYQDFPRLSSILARDGFVPRQFQNRGDRLVFSNGIMVLSAFAILLVWAFDADLTRLIQLYVVGVFTAFTLSQSGMVRRWTTTREPGWRRGAIINGIGAIATGIVLVIVAVTKFAGGAWIVISAMPVFVTFFLFVYRHYANVRRALERGAVRYGDQGTNHVVLVLTEVDAAAAEAFGYVRSFRPASLDVVYAGDAAGGDPERAWQALAPNGPPLDVLDGREPVSAVVEHVRRIPRAADDFVTVVIPEMFRKRSLLHAIRKPVTFRLKVRLLREAGVVVTDVPVVANGGRLDGVDGRPLIPERVVALVFVASPHDATVRAVNYARTLDAEETRAVFLATEPEEAPAVLEGWAARGIGVQLEVVDAPFRDLGPPLLEEVRRVTADPGTVVSVVVPEFLVSRWWHRILHNNRALFIKRALLFEPRVILSSVPYPLGSRGRPNPRRSGGSGSAGSATRRRRPT
ncbi:MAG TPA: APC family permease [Actinomycetota bacterium]|jgi:amino acid transporter|nr:APC family permease [Actinomycetota bacterium]